MFYNYDALPFGLPLFIALIVWSAVWKGIGLWKSGRNNQITWFVVMFIINSAGILPIIYLLWFQKKNPEPIVLPKKKSVSAKAVKKKAKK